MKKTEILTDCNNVYKAMSNDKVALAAIELKYGKINNMGDLYRLGADLYTKLNGTEKNMFDTQTDLSLRQFDETKKLKNGN